jgi:hypothetical protein
VNGIGFSLGPLVGSILYKFGGFSLPLIVTGSLIGTMATISFALPKLIENLKIKRAENINKGKKRNSNFVYFPCRN